MDVTRLAQARKLWNSPYVDREANRLNQRKWVWQLRALGDKWLLAKRECEFTKDWRRTMRFDGSNLEKQ